jgi:multimeric flavodoxin WrbA
MIRLLAVSGSPVVGSSTDLLLKRIIDAAAIRLASAASFRVDFVKLNDLKYIPCQACGESPEPKWCFFEDDLTVVYRQLAACDALVFGTPVYFDSVSAQAKSFIDRCNCFRPPDFSGRDPEHDFLKRLPRKRPGLMVLVGGERQECEIARRVIAGFFKWVEVESLGLVIHRSTDYHRHGTVANDSAALKEADRLGEMLAGRLLEQGGGQDFNEEEVL